MKVNFFRTAILFIFLFFSFQSFSQLSFGIKSGINIATTRDLIANPKNRLGLHSGCFLKIPLNKVFFLEPEFFYSSKGDKSENQVNSSKIVTRFNYLSIPLLIGYKIDTKTSFVLGPELSYLVSAQIVIQKDQILNASKNYPSKFDIGLNMGINYEFVKNISADIRYCYGFKTMYYIDNAGNRNSSYNGGNRVFQIGILYTIKK